MVSQDLQEPSEPFDTTMAFYTSVVVSPLKSFANQSKNSLERIPSSAEKKIFTAKLRKLRWRIYQKIKFKKRRLKKTFDYYKKQVDKFLIEFSLKLKPKEVIIWTEKVAKTSADVLSINRKVHNVNKFRH